MMITKEQLEELIASIFAEQYKSLVASIQTMIEKAVNAKPFPSYKGVWDAETLFSDTDMVTHKGAIWHACASSQGVRPGTDEGAKVWKLAVKSAKPDKLPTFELSAEGELTMVSEGGEKIVIGEIKTLIKGLLTTHGVIKETT